MLQFITDNTAIKLSDKIDFLRDIIAYMVVLAAIVAVVYDGQVMCSIVYLPSLIYNHNTGMSSLF